jgi:hypothetical protein
MKAAVAFIIGFIGFQILFRFVLFPNTTHSNTITSEPIQISQIDSLQNVIDSLQAELESQAERTDSKEKKYKEILFEYELGIDRIKNYHPRAYEDFHRILAYREDYSREAEIENKKRLNEYNR